MKKRRIKVALMSDQKHQASFNIYGAWWLQHLFTVRFARISALEVISINAQSSAGHRF